ncbi:DUF2079 domain-containing protein [Streptomyces sp. NPDC001817]|uniref:DUF2079 domain-containing protein n=1 Tax=Streptomyces sp. NPDC001817 TaxID=3154398 RepID=UPI00332585E4
MQAPFTSLSTAVPAQQKPVGTKAAPEPWYKGRFNGTWWVWAMAGALFCVYAAVSMRIHQRILSNSYDLGIFEQVVRSYAEGHLPVSELKGPNFPILGDHFSPILALVAPFYLLWRSPETLLLVQAALIALSVVPLTLWARRTLSSSAGAVIGACYGLSWGIASAVGFDFHEVAFAVPLLAFSLAALGSDRLTAAACWALPLLVVKEDLGFTVLAIGLLIARRGARRLGFVTAAVGVTGTLLALLVILPAFNPSGSFAYWFLADGPAGSPGTSAPGGGSGVLELLYRGTVGLVTPQTKVETLALTLSPTLFLAVRSPLLWAAVPTLAWRFFSNNYVHWGTGYHYSLVLMPIVFAAFIHALIRLDTGLESLRLYLVGAVAALLLVLPNFPFCQLFTPATWRTDPRVAIAHTLMKKIPDGATVQASTYLVPQLTNRTSVSLYGYPVSRPFPQWIMVDTWVPERWRWPQTFEAERASLDQNRHEGYRTVADRDGFVLLHLSHRPDSASSTRLIDRETPRAAVPKGRLTQ